MTRGEEGRPRWPACPRAFAVAPIRPSGRRHSRRTPGGHDLTRLPPACHRPQQPEADFTSRGDDGGASRRPPGRAECRPGRRRSPSAAAIRSSGSASCSPPLFGSDGSASAGIPGFDLPDPAFHGAIPHVAAYVCGFTPSAPGAIIGPTLAREGGSMRRLVGALVVIALTLGPAPAGMTQTAAPSPTGQMTWAVHFTLAP